MKFLKCCLHILSFIADLSPIGTFKSAVELITGRDFISQEKLSKKERLLCIVGLIPVVGKAAQKIAVAKNCTKLAKGIFHANRIVKAVNIGNNIKKEGELEIEFALTVPYTIRGWEDSLCDAADFIKYDNGLVATSLRIAGAVVCSFTAPFVYAVKSVAAISYYSSGYAMGRTKEEMDKYMKKMGDEFSSKYDKALEYLANGGYNARFLGDVGAAFGTVINYYNFASLSDEGFERVQGLQNEAARRYNERKKRPGGNEYIKPNQKKWKEDNNERFRFNRGLEKAKQKAIEDDLNKNKDKINNLGRLFGFVACLFGCLWWIMKKNFMNYLKNKFGNGDYGFHTCPYGCGRPIPNSFKGCTELLSVFPDYFK